MGKIVTPIGSGPSGPSPTVTTKSGKMVTPIGGGGGGGGGGIGGFLHGVEHTLGKTGSGFYKMAVDSPAGIYSLGKLLGGVAAEDVSQAIHHPTQTQSLHEFFHGRSGSARERLGSVEAGQGRSFITSAKHPLRDPASTIVNIGTLASLGAGSIARIGAAGKAMEAADAAGTSRIAAASRALRSAPKPGVRSFDLGVEPKETWYHAAPVSQLQNIQREGLVAGRPGQFGGRGGIHLAKSPSAARDIARGRTEATGEAHTVLKVEIPKAWTEHQVTSEGGPMHMVHVHGVPKEMITGGGGVKWTPEPTTVTVPAAKSALGRGAQRAIDRAIRARAEAKPGGMGASILAKQTQRALRAQTRYEKIGADAPVAALHTIAKRGKLDHGQIMALRLHAEGMTAEEALAKEQDVLRAAQEKSGHVGKIETKQSQLRTKRLEEAAQHMEGTDLVDPHLQQVYQHMSDFVAGGPGKSALAGARGLPAYIRQLSEASIIGHKAAAKIAQASVPATALQKVAEDLVRHKETVAQNKKAFAELETQPVGKAHDLAKMAGQRWSEGLTPTQDQLVREYSTGGRYLSGQEVGQLGRALNKASLPKETIVQRGFTPEHNFARGDEIPVKGLMSTTLDPSEAEIYMKEALNGDPPPNGAWRMHIRLPEGTRAAHVGHMNEGHWDSSEVLAKGGGKLRITRVKRNTEGPHDVWASYEGHKINPIPQDLHPPGAKNAAYLAMKDSENELAQVQAQHDALKKASFQEPSAPLTTALGRAPVHVIDSINNATKLAILYLKPAYAVPNALGNAALNVLQQGFAAPMNIAHSLGIMYKMPPEYWSMIDTHMGEGFAAALRGESGHLAHATQVMANVWGKGVDVPFRRSSFLFEARKAGFDTPEKMMDLLRNPENHQDLLHVVNKANNEIIDYGRLSEKERNIVRRVIFFYPWVKGSTIYSGHLLMNHPVAAGALAHAGTYGAQQTEAQFGPHPSYLEGAIKDFGGMINPAAAAILQTPAQVGSTIAGVLGAPRAPNADVGQFQTPFFSVLTNLLAKRNVFTGQAYKPNEQNLPFALWDTLVKSAPQYQLAQALAPGVFGKPKSKLYPAAGPGPALGRFFLGGLYPRPYSPGRVHSLAWQEQHPR